MSVAIRRIFLYTKDVQAITGLSARSARRILARIRKKLGKKKNQGVTVAEFCEEMSMDPEEVYKFMLP